MTTGKSGATDLVMNSGTYVAIIYVDELGNVTMAGATATNVIEAGNNLPATSEGVYQAIQSSALTVVDVVQSDNMNPVTSNAVYDAIVGKVPFVRYNTGSSGVKSYVFQIRDSETIRVTVMRTAENYSVYLFAYIGGIVTYATISNNISPVSSIQVSNSNVTITTQSWATYTNVIIERFYKGQTTRSETKGGEDETKYEEPIEEPKEEEKK